MLKIYFITMDNKTLYDNIIYEEKYNGINASYSGMHNEGNKLKVLDFALEKQLLLFIVKEASNNQWYVVSDAPYKMIFCIPLLFENASDSLKKDKTFILSIIRKVSYILKYVDESLKNDYFFILNCIKNNYYSICLFEKHKKYKTFALEALLISDNPYGCFYNFWISTELQTIISVKKEIYRTYTEIEILQMLIKEEEIKPIYKMKCYDCYIY